MTDFILWIFILMLLCFVGMSLYYAMTMQQALKRYSEELARQSRVANEAMARVAMAKDVHDLKEPHQDKISTLVDNVYTRPEVVASENLTEVEFNRVITEQINGNIEEEEN